jgi:hypothetical protein
MREHLDRGEYSKYVYHLAELAGVFIAMGEEIAEVLLTENEALALCGDGIAGALLQDFKEAREDDGTTD